jgi:hypothetical protein
MISHFHDVIHVITEFCIFGAVTEVTDGFRIALSGAGLNDWSSSHGMAQGFLLGHHIYPSPKVHSASCPLSTWWLFNAG